MQQSYKVGRNTTDLMKDIPGKKSGKCQKELSCSFVIIELCYDSIIYTKYSNKLTAQILFSQTGVTFLIQQFRVYNNLHIYCH